MSKTTRAHEGRDEAPSDWAAAQAALRRYDWAQAREVYESVLAHEESPEAWEDLAQARRWLNDEPATLEADERAFQLFFARGDREDAARTAVWLAIDINDFTGQSAVANGWLRRAHRLLDGAPPSSSHALLAAVEAYIALMAHNDATSAIALADNALEIARECGPIDVEMVALAMKGLAFVTSGDIEPGMAMLDEASTAALGAEVSSPDIRSTILCALMDACDRVRDVDRATQWCERIRSAAEQWSLPAVVTVCRPHYAVVLTWRGLWSEAEAELTAAIDEATAIRAPMAIEGIVRLAELRTRQGRLDEAEALFARVEHEELAQIGRAELALLRGDVDLALDLAARHVRRVPPADRVQRAPGLEMLVRAQLAAGDIEDAQSTASELDRIADRIGTRAMRGAARHASGLIAEALGDWASARVAFEDATDCYQVERAPFEAARAQADLARVLATTGERASARREWERALRSFESIGAVLDALEVRKLLAEPTSSDGQGGLTPREVDVLRLIAAGRSNADIADELVLSVRTVERHISTIYGKLGVSGRSARAAATAHAFALGVVSTSI